MIGPRVVRSLTLGRGARAILFAALVAGVVEAQTPVSTDTLTPVRVTVARAPATSWLSLPLAITVVRPGSARPGGRDFALESVLAHVPGLVIESRTNPTQDPRISIRGFGSRAAFGVRGVRVVRDGIPLTLADGQTPVDYLELQSVGVIEVLRGSASALYGNAAGGVVELHTDTPPDESFQPSARAWVGGFGDRRWSASAAGTANDVAYRALVAHATSDGSRDYARRSATQGVGYAAFPFAGGRATVLALGHDQPEAQNPGSLTAAELAADPRQAERQMIRRAAGKEVRQGQLGVTTEWEANGRTLALTVHGSARALDNPLPFAVIDVDRRTGGAGVRGVLPLGDEARLTLGVDAQWMWDDRRNFSNCADTVPTPVSANCPDAGAQRGAIRLDQEEAVRSIGPYAMVEAALAPRLTMLGGLRTDAVRYTVRDAIVSGSDPDDSGSRTVHAVSPMVGVLVRLAPAHSVYATASSAFEAPTTTELANRPDGSAGFNLELEPQRSVTIEAGVKGITGVVQYDVAAFDTRVRDELVPFEAAGASGRRFFRNAGRTTRRGIEVAARAMFDGGEVGISATVFDFRYAAYRLDDADFAGRRIPGVPRRRAQAYATARRGNAFLTVEGTLASSSFGDDANTVNSAGYGVAGLRLGSTSLFGRRWIQPVIGVENLTDRTYVPSLVLNSASGRYFEPAPGRALYAALAVTAR
ncbi:MAG TPA: TonB-dependent receptor [Gemmatimonadaceae bacterium]|nr:TonB-dependent receptor [Gemmatimonadaceae bacterium]